MTSFGSGLTSISALMNFLRGFLNFFREAKSQLLPASTQLVMSNLFEEVLLLYFWKEEVETFNNFISYFIRLNLYQE